MRIKKLCLISLFEATNNRLTRSTLWLLLIITKYPCKTDFNLKIAIIRFIYLINNKTDEIYLILTSRNVFSGDNILSRTWCSKFYLIMKNILFVKFIAAMSKKNWFFWKIFFQVKFMKIKNKISIMSILNFKNKISKFMKTFVLSWKIMPTLLDPSSPAGLLRAAVSSNWLQLYVL